MPKIPQLLYFFVLKKLRVRACISWLEKLVIVLILFQLYFWKLSQHRFK